MAEVWHRGRASTTVVITAVELVRVALPLVRPFRTSFGVEEHRDILLVRVEAFGSEGWGECVAGLEPLYCSEYVEAAAHVIEHHLLPRVLAAGRHDPAEVEEAMAPVRGHAMAKAAVATAALDAWLRSSGQALSEFLGAVRAEVASGVSVGIPASDRPETAIAALLDEVDGYVSAGYRRIKLKIQPGFDLAPVRAVRERFGDEMLLQVDANSAYSLADARHLALLDAFDLLLIEQPLPEDDLLGHAALAEQLRTPICLDESIHSARDAATAIALKAAAIVNVKPGRVGGYLEARRVHDVCVAAGVPVWCGGMLETGIGRAANVALAAMPGFTLPGDTSASDRYYRTDLTEPFVLRHGTLAVPVGPGIGVVPLPEVLAEVVTSRRVLHPRL